MYETKIYDIDDLQKCLTQTCFDFDRNIIDAGVTLWAHVCMLVVDTLNACPDLNIHLRGSPEHFMKLSLQLDACNDYFVVSIKSWTCVDMNLRFFDLHKAV